MKNNKKESESFFEKHFFGIFFTIAMILIDLSFFIG